MKLVKMILFLLNFNNRVMFNRQGLDRDMVNLLINQG